MSGAPSTYTFVVSQRGDVARALASEFSAVDCAWLVSGEIIPTKSNRVNSRLYFFIESLLANSVFAFVVMVSERRLVRAGLEYRLDRMSAQYLGKSL